MSPDVIFSIASTLILPGWLALILAPLFPVWSDRIATYLVPVLLSLAYTALIMVFFADADGDFSSLPNVMKLFTIPEVALAGWIHYLAFDLFVGAWEVRTARRIGMSHWLVLPCLPVTLMFGPAGFVLFLIIRLSVAAARRPSPTESMA